jgi:flagellar FliJ protein
MKKFKFQLEKVFEFKQHIEKTKQQELAVIHEKLESSKQFLEHLLQKKEAYLQERIQVVKNGGKRVEIMMLEQFSNHLKKRIQYQHQIIKNITTDFLKKQAELREAVKEKKSLELYKDQKLEEYQKEALVFEQNFFDEVALRKHYFS